MPYPEEAAIVRQALIWIEAHLKEEIVLEDAARVVSVSKFHFHRIFHAHVGMPFAAFVRHRRLANAAGELTSSDRRILDIAVDYAFESQAAFTRAFKKVYRMSPGRYRTYFGSFMESQVVQSKEENVMAWNESSAPHGWILAGSHPGDYETAIDLGSAHQGRASGRLQSRAERPGGFGTMMQSFRADRYRGGRFELSAFIRTEDVAQWCGLWMRVDGKHEEVLQFDNMGNRPIRGTTPWSRHIVVLDVPEDGESISFGVLLNGGGRVWIDSVRFEQVGPDVPSTNLEDPVALPEHPVNLDFEAVGD